MNRRRLVNTLFLCGIGITVILDIIFLAPITVLKDRRLEAPLPVYHRGDRITLQNTFTKLRKAHGVSERKLVCQSQGAVSTYEMSEAEGTKPAGEDATTLELVIPVNVVVPASCQVHIDTTYDVFFGMRHLPVNSVNSNTFKVE